MAFTSRLSFGVRHGAMLSSSMRLRGSNARLFSSILQNSSVSLHRSPRAVFQPRHLSTTPSTPVDPADLAQEPISAAAAVPDATSTISSGIDAVSAVANQIPPLHYGDLSALGLVGWNPAGLVRWSFEVINVSMDMPWFWTIVAGTVFWRLVCVPFTVVSMRENARMLPHTQQLTDMREALAKAASTKNTLEIMKVQTAMKAYQKKHGLSPLKSAYGLVQLPVTLGLFFGVQKMASLPVEQLKQSGLAAIPDLTVPDPTWIMPAALMAVVNTQISIGVKDMDLSARPGMGHLMNGLRVLSFAGFYMMTDFSAGLMASLLTTSAFTLLQTWALQRTAVRKMLDIPIIPKEKQGKLPPFRDSIKAAVDYVKGGGSPSLSAQQRPNPFQRPRRP